MKLDDKNILENILLSANQFWQAHSTFYDWFTFSWNLHIHETCWSVDEHPNSMQRTMVIFNKIDTKLWNYGIEFVVKLLPCIIYHVIARFRPIFAVYWLCYLTQSLNRTPSTKLIKVSILKQVWVGGVNLSSKPENEPFLSPLLTGFKSELVQYVAHKADIWFTETEQLAFC